MAITYVSREFLEKQIKNKDIVAFEIADASKNLIDETHNELLLQGPLIDRLKETLDSMQGDFCIVRLYYKAKKKADGGADLQEGNHYRYYVDISQGHKKNRGIEIGYAPSVDTKALQSSFQTEMNLRLEIVRLENIIREKDRIIKELEEDEGNPNEDKIFEMIGHILPHLAKSSAPINGVENPINGVPVSDRKELLKEAINRMLKIDPKFPENLTKLADFAEKNPLKYKAFTLSHGFR